jgi:hypothetical protein
MLHLLLFIIFDETPGYILIIVKNAIVLMHINIYNLQFSFYE